MTRKFIVPLVALLLLFSACAPRPNVRPAGMVPSFSEPAPTPNVAVPNFDHIVIVFFENREVTTVLNSPNIPVFTNLLKEGTLLTQYYALVHPSMGNYIALIGGDPYGFDHACKNCDINVSSLPDLIERSGRTWKTYQEDMPDPCHLDAHDGYVTKHNPFIFFSPIVKNKPRCDQDVVPLAQMSVDLADGSFPNYAFIMPNLCNAGHDCGLDAVDQFIKNTVVDTLIPNLQKESDNYLVIVMWEEGETNDSCCSLPADAGGRVPVLLLSPKVKADFQDATQYTHYSLLKTISEAWGLPLLGHAADDSNVLITVPWQ